MKAYALHIQKGFYGSLPTSYIKEVEFVKKVDYGVIIRVDGNEVRIGAQKEGWLAYGATFNNTGWYGYALTPEDAKALQIHWFEENIKEWEDRAQSAQAKADEWINAMNQLTAIDAPLCKKFGVDFHSAGGALTLRPSDIGEHPSGWVVSGEIKEDYYLWVNKFEATHPTLGRVWGDFEDQVFYTSIEAYDDFRKYFSPEDWDYGDI